MTSTQTQRRPEDELLPAPQLVGYGLQHILAMFGGVIAVPLIIGGAAGLDPAQTAVLLSSALFVSGVATVLQTIGVPFLGSRLPLVQGVSFASVSTMLTIVGNEGGGEHGLRVVFGAVLVAAAIGFVVAPLFSHVIRFFPPVVTGSVITVVGISLLPVAGGWLTSQQPQPTGTAVALAGATLLAVLLLTKVPVLARLSILLGLVVGTVVALVSGQASFDGVGGSSAVALPTPFAFGGPVFEVGAIVSMTIVVLVIMVETTADILAVGEVVGTPVDRRRIADGLRADMLSSAVAPVFNTFPATAFAQNVGLVAMSGIKSRYAVAVGGVVLALLGLSPWLAAVVGIIPSAVLAGAGIVLFGSVAASGIRTLGKVDFDGNHNLVVVATSVAFGVVPIAYPEFWSGFPEWWRTVFDSEISAAAIVAFVLNLFFNVLLPGTPRRPAALTTAAPAVGTVGAVDVQEGRP